MTAVAADSKGCNICAHGQKHSEVVHLFNYTHLTTLFQPKLLL